MNLCNSNGSANTIFMKDKNAILRLAEISGIEHDFSGFRQNSVEGATLYLIIQRLPEAGYVKYRYFTIPPPACGSWRSLFAGGSTLFQEGIHAEETALHYRLSQ